MTAGSPIDPPPEARGEMPGGDPPRGKLRTWSGLDGSSHKQRTEWRGSSSLGTPPRPFFCGASLQLAVFTLAGRGKFQTCPTTEAATDHGQTETHPPGQ